MMSNIISRIEAKNIKLTKYFTGIPCKNGHIAERYVSNSDCIECRKEYKQNHYTKNKHQYIQNSKKYRKINKEILDKSNHNYYLQNADKIKDKSKKYYNSNKTKILYTNKINRNISKYGTAIPTNDQVKKLTIENNRNNFGRDYGIQKIWTDNSYIWINCPLWLSYHHNILKQSCIEISDQYMPDIHNSTIALRLKLFNIDICRFTTSNAEKQISNFIQSLNIKCLTGYRSLIAPYEIDIFIPSHNLAIEYCGLYWHCEMKKPTNYHVMKYELCKKKGIRLITIFEDEWLHKQDLVKDKLSHILGASTKDVVFARKCIISPISSKDKSDFFNLHHIQNDGPSSINLGLIHNNMIVACMGFIKENNNIYNLSRYATSKKVIGGFSKLLKYFEKSFLPMQIYTFADLRWSEGDLYNKLNFNIVKILPPDYSYINYKYVTRQHKFNFRHKRLAKKLDNYDPQLSEHQNCLNHKIYRIYDCGKIKYVKYY